LHSVEIKSVDLEKVCRSADQYATRLLATNEDVEEIIVFGSFAEGTYAPGSDLDVFIVLSRADKTPRERIAAFLPNQFPVPMDVFPFTRAEMAERDSSPLIAAVGKSNWRYKQARRVRGQPGESAVTPPRG
jgi:predicted nucleotidyltransferase